ncbi:hypothetical protein TRIUR3_32559 [Triticum urartu]|uniref:Uncharacterized protein n=1 Tax=Triticum urartu TaxID=4572 RepID=M7Z9D7_TRIUA|nr:hypothetical protein TRIUR3_32559 [Triticum urartu]
MADCLAAKSAETMAVSILSTENNCLKLTLFFSFDGKITGTKVVEVEGGGDRTQEAELAVGAGENAQLHWDEDGRGLAVQREAEGASGRGRGVVLCPNCCCSMQRAAGGRLELQGSAHRRDGWVHGGGVGAPWRAVAAAY